MSHFVYKYVINNEIVYIGKNDTNLHNRICQHNDNRADKLYQARDNPHTKIFYIQLANRAESDGLETLLINKYKPKFNIAKNMILSVFF